MTKVKTVNGFITDGDSLKAAEIKCRLAINQKSETLSFEIDGIMIGANFKEVEKIIRESRERKNERRHSSIPNQRRTRVIREG